MSFWKQAHHPLLLVLILASFVFGSSSVGAQNQTVIRLEMPSTSLQTGQTYDVNIRIENAPQFWALDLTLEYDPALIYVIGTKSGSPITTGEMFGTSSSITVQNRVEGGQVRFTISKVGETAPAEGSGVVGTLRIYPLAAGTTRMQFPHLDVVGLSSYSVNAVDVTTETIAAAPALLDLTITGNPAAPPSEATATPEPTEVPVEATPMPGQELPTAVPTLENIVFSTATPAPLTTQEVPSSGGTSSILMVAAGLIVVAIIGLGALMATQRRKRK